VANVSAGSWGPGNLLAYVEVFGVFDADVVFVVLSSHDATDVPQFGNLVGTANFPDVKPKWALSEAMFRYLPRYLPNWKRTESQAAQVDIEQIGDERDYPAGPAFAQLLERLDQAGAVVIFLQHADRSELEGGFMLGHEQMAATARAQGVAVRQLAPRLEDALEQGDNPYRDHIHLNPTGQRVLAEEMIEATTPFLLPQVEPTARTPR